jgi:hypothetical protein
VLAFYETRDLELKNDIIKQCNEGEHGARFSDSEWNYPTTGDVTSVEYGKSNGNDGTEKPEPQPQQFGAAGGNHARMLATLMPTPRSFHDLWQEHQHGLVRKSNKQAFIPLTAWLFESLLSQTKYCVPCQTRPYSRCTHR